MRYLGWLWLVCACATPPLPLPDVPDYAPAGVEDHSVPLYDGTGQFVCSGVVLAAHTIVTAAHCAERVSRASNDRIPITRKVFPFGSFADVMIAETRDTLPVSPATIGTRRSADLWMAGYGCDRYHERLQVRPLRRQDGPYVDGTICQGDSGAPVYSARGELVGIIRARFESQPSGSGGGVVEWLF